MHSVHRSRLLFGAAIAAVHASSLALTVRGADGTWINNNTAGGTNWSTAANWSGGIIATGNGAIAAFDTLDVPANVTNTVILDSNRTVGSLVFGDAGSPANGDWLLRTPNVGATTTITLLRAGFTPIIWVDDRTAGIDVILDGSNGLEKAGAGTLLLYVPATYTGQTIISAGTIKLLVDNGLPVTTTLQVENGGSFDLNGQDQTVSRLEPTVTGTITDSTATGGKLTVNNSSADIVSMRLTGSLNLTKVGAGALTLSANNTFTGNTSITAGSIVLGNSLALQNSTVTTLNNGLNLNGLAAATLGGLAGKGNINLGNTILTVGNNSQSTTYSGVLSGAGGIIKVGSGTTVLSDANTYSGLTDVAAGKLKLGTFDSLNTAGTLKVRAGATFDLDAHDQTVGFLTAANTGTITNSNAQVAIFTVNNAAADSSSNVFTGSLVLYKSGAGNLTLSATGNSYSGLTRVLAGTLTSGVNDVLPTGNSFQVDSGATFDLNGHNQTVTFLNVGSGTITDSGAAHTFTVNNSSNNSTSVKFTGTLLLTKTGTGTLTLNSTGNTYTGATTVKDGTLKIGVDNGLPTTTTLAVKPTLAPAGTFDLNGHNQTVAFLDQFSTGTITNSSANLATLTVNNASADSSLMSFAGNLALTKTGAGTLTLFTTNTHTGNTTISAGSIILGNAPAAALALQNSTVAISLNDGLNVNGQSATLGGLSGSGNLDYGSTTLTIGNNNASTTYSGTLSGTGALTKTGAGTLTLSGTSTVGGTLTVNAGKLATAANDLNANGNITINGGTLQTEDNTLDWADAKTMTIQTGGHADFFGQYTTPTNAIINLTGAGSQLNSSFPSNPTQANFSVTHGASMNVTLGGALSAVGLFVGAGTIGPGAITVDGAGSSINSSSRTQIGTLAGTGTLTFRNNATGDLGTLQIGVPVSTGTTAFGNGTLNVESNATLSTGNISIAVNPRSGNIGTFNLNGGSITQTGASTLTIGGTSLSNAQLNVTNGTFTTGTGAITINATGALNILSNGSFLANAAITSTGTIRVDSSLFANTLTLNGGILAGHGTIESVVTAGSAAHTVAPGNGLPATATDDLIISSLATNNLTTMVFNLVNPTACDLIDVVDDLTLNGGKIQLNDNNAPQGYYKIIGYQGPILGTGVSSLSIITPAPNATLAYVLDTTHDPGFIDIHKVLLGDANGDNIVDGGDFDTWFTHLQASGAGYANGDLNNDGLVDGGDFDIWFTHLQNTFGNPAAQWSDDPMYQSFNPLAVPEPGTLSLLFLAPAALFASRRSRPRHSAASPTQRSPFFSGFDCTSC